MLVLFPLALLEFTVVVSLWLAAIGLVVAPLVVAAVWAGGVHPAPTWVPDVWVVVGAVLALLVGLVLIPVAASVSRGLMVLHRAVVEGLLCISPTEALRQDVERLRGSRSAAVELEASELRRIERDLHDGAQQRLVALAIDLGLAEERIDTDPASARKLVAGARDQARQALAELRDLVRGVAPAILVDRGLVAALGAVAGGCPVPTFIDSEVTPLERLPPAVERAAYFVVVESLANAAKHSEATRCDVFLRRSAKPSPGRGPRQRRRRRRHLARRRAGRPARPRRGRSTGGSACRARPADPRSCTSRCRSGRADRRPPRLVTPAVARRGHGHRDRPARSVGRPGPRPAWLARRFRESVSGARSPAP